MKRKSIIASVASIIVALSAHAAAKSYDFKDPKGVNNISFRLDAPLESISGTGNAVSGTIHFDPAHPDKTSGKIVLGTESLKVTNNMMVEHLHSANWLDVAKYPEITFVSESLKNIKEVSGTVSADLVGSITVKGISKQITVPIRINYLPGKLADRTNGKAKGDLLVVRANFSINRSDFNIMAGKATDKVAETIEIRLAIAGAAYDS